MKQLECSQGRSLNFIGNKMSQARAITQNSLWVTASYALARGAQVLAQAILARFLFPQDFGTWAMVLVVTGLTNQFKEAAIAQVLVQKGFGDKAQVNAVYSLGINISLAMFGLQILAGYLLSLFFSVTLVFPLTAAVALVFLINAGTGCHSAFLTREMKFRALAICDTAAGFARLLGTVTAAGLGAGVWSFVAGELTAATVDSLLKRNLSGYRFAYRFWIDSQALVTAKGYIQGLLSINLAVYANTTGDNLVIGKLMGRESLGFYNLAYQLAMLPVFVLSQINRVNFSVLSQQDSVQQQRYLSQLLEVYAFVAAPIYAVAFLIAPWLIPLLYGHRWTEAVPIFQVLLLFGYTRGFMSILGTALNALGYPGTNAAINWILVPLSIPSYFLGVKLASLFFPNYALAGAIGVAIAVVTVLGIGSSIAFWLATSRKAGWPISTLMKPAFLPTLCIGLALGIVFLIQILNGIQIYWQLLLAILIYPTMLCIFSAGRFSKLIWRFARR
jgi:lipopolysaccharide exporter